MTTQELKASATYIKKLASFSDAEDRISLYLDSLFASKISQTNTTSEAKTDNTNVISSLLYFTHKEIKNMSTTFKKVFIANGLCAHVLKKPSGKRTFCFEIRYRANGYKISASSTNLQRAKEKFLEKTKPNEIERYFVGTATNPHNFSTLERFTLF